MLQNTKRSQDHREILETKASTPGGLSMDEGLDSPITMLQNTKHASQDHGKASNPLEDCKWMRGWIARKAAKQKAWSAGAWDRTCRTARPASPCRRTVNGL